NRDPVPAQALADLEQVPDAVWAKVDTSAAKAPIFAGGTPAVANGKVEILYFGAEYCPYCAADRWAIVAALSRFGTFSNLSTVRSSLVDVYPGTPTFSFHGSTYQSDYVRFDAVEIQTNKLGADGNYTRLDTPTAEQEQLVRRYDAPPFVPAQAQGTIPFLLVGRQYLWSGSPYSPGLFGGKEWPEIAAGIKSGEPDYAKAVLAEATLLTASICRLDGEQPETVCKGAAVQKAMAALPTTGPQ
ncbi:MAG TPA: DUF929 family protein, partial [Limnochordia bacterium]|nr:DUF929 family protein [Limnochordia bacterium]